MTLSFLRGDTAVPALPTAQGSLEAGQLLALGTCFPLQRTVAFCSPLLGARLVPVSTSLQKRLLPTPSPQKNLGEGGSLQAASVTACPFLARPQLATQLLSGHREDLAWVGFGHNRQLTLLQFLASPDQDIPMSLSVTQHLPRSQSLLPNARWVKSKLPGFAWLFISGQAGFGGEQKGRLRRKTWSFALGRGTHCPCMHRYTVFLAGISLTSSSTDNKERFPSVSSC